MDNITKSWLAGFIDGEGYIGITYQLKKPKENISTATPRYHPFLIITSTDRDILDHINQLVGDGKIYTQSQRSKNTKEAYQYKLTKQLVLLPLLYSLHPYLKLKKRQCDVLIAFIERRQTIKPKTGRGSRGLSSFGKIDHEMYEELLSLNKRGL